MPMADTSVVPAVIPLEEHDTDASAFGGATETEAEESHVEVAEAGGSGVADDQDGMDLDGDASGIMDSGAGMASPPTAKKKQQSDADIGFPVSRVKRLAK